MTVDRIGERLRRHRRAANKTLNQVMPCLVEALFADFPGESGKAGKVRVAK